MQMLKKIIVLILLSTLVLNASFVVLAKDENFVTIKGTMNPPYSNNEKISVFLLSTGKTFEDFKKDDMECVDGFSVFSPDYYGNYECTLKTSEIGDIRTILIGIGGQVFEKSVNISDNKTIDINPEIHVSIYGDDSAAGTQSAPVKSIECAQEITKGYMKYNLPIDIIIHDGEYRVNKTIEFDSDDSGKEGAWITYRAADGENVELNASLELDINGFEKITDMETLSRLPQKAVGHVLKMDLTKQGLTKSDLWDMNLYYRGNTPAVVGSGANQIGVYLNGKKQNLSRWPNSGYAIIGETNTGGKYVENGGIPSENQDKDHASFSYSGDEPSRWLTAKDICIEGYLGCEWAGEWAGVENIDTENKKITLNSWTAYGVVQGQRWSAINLLEEIDIPGEWYIDREAMMLYYYPPHELDPLKDTFEITTTDLYNTGMDFIRINNAAYLKFEGICFKQLGAVKWSNRLLDNGNGIYIDNSHNITISNCKFKNIGRNGIVFGGTDITIDSCDFFNIAYTGIIMTYGGDRSTLTSGNNVISNNHLSDIGSLKTAGESGVMILGGVGTIVRNNLIHNITAGGVNYAGNENLIEYNEIYRTNITQNDAGAVYGGRNWSQYGTVITHNYIHDLQKNKFTDTAFVNSAIYWDDAHCGNTAKENIIVYNDKTNSTFLRHHGGRDNIIKDNIVVNSLYGISATSGLYWLSVEDVKNSVQYKSLQEVPYNKEPFLSKYPNMSKLYELIDKTGHFTSQLTSQGNVFVNVSGDDINGTCEFTSEGDVRTNKMGIFVDPDNQDYRIKSEYKKQLGMSDGILDENFDINNISILSGNHEMPGKDFNMLYPVNAEEIYSDDGSVELVWEQAEYADIYEYEVSTDDNFTNIVESGETEYTTAIISGLSEGINYYWKVKAKNISRQYRTDWQACGTGSFTMTSEMVDVESLSLSMGGKKLESVSGLSGIAEINGTAFSRYINPINADVYVVLKKDDKRIESISLTPIVLKNGINNITSQINCTGNSCDVELYIWDKNIMPLTLKKLVIKGT